MAKFSFFSFEWLSSNERKQKKEEMATRVVEKVAAEPVPSVGERVQEALIKEFHQQALQFEIPKPYKSCRLLGDTVLVVLNDGTTLTKDDPSLIGQIRQAQSEEAVLQLFIHREYEKKPDEVSRAEAKMVFSNIDILKDNEDFTVEGENVFLNGVNLNVPAIVCASFIELLERIDYEEEWSEEWLELSNQYSALKMFWAWAALNPIESSRESLLEFVQKNDITITSNGLLLMYRRVVKKEADNHTLVSFVSNQYSKIKRFKKSPKNYNVWKDGEYAYKLEKGDIMQNDILRPGYGIVGNLEALYLDLPSMQEGSYTDAHTRTKDIRVGQVYKEDEDKINLDRGESCGAGLHVGSRSFGFSGFGDVGVIALVNPMFVRSVPNHECEKMRVSEMFIAAVAELGEYEELVEDGEILDFSNEYCKESLEELEGMLAEKKIDKISCQEHLPAISIVDVAKIKEMLKERIVEV